MQPGRYVPVQVPGSDAVVTYFLPATLAEQSIPSAAAPPSAASAQDIRRIGEVLLPFVISSQSCDPAPDQLDSCPQAALTTSVEALQREFRAAAGRLSTLRAALGLSSAHRSQGMHWVGGSSPDRAWLVPPPGSMVADYVEDLECRLREPGLSSTVSLPMFAFQLIHVHPYEDGNGRVARLLVWMMGLELNAVSESLALALTMNFRKEWTNSRLNRARQGDVQPWLNELLQVRSWIEAHSSALQARFDLAIDEAFGHEHLARLRPKVENHMVTCGALDRRALVSACGANTRLADRYTQTMVEHGWMQFEAEGRRLLHWPSASSARSEWLEWFLTEFDAGVGAS